MFSTNNNELYFKNDNNFSKKHFFNLKMDLIKEITNQKMNNECFDCLKAGPKYISINNGIFLCENCAKIHKSFPENISFVIDNNLNLLSNNYLKYLYYGGNKNLDFFINYDYPGLQNYSPEVLYKTQAMIYYREELKCRIEGKPRPICPNNVMAYKIVSESGLINIRDKKKYKTKNLKNNYDIINNSYNNYNTYNNFNIIRDDNDEKTKKISLINKNEINKYCSVVNKNFFSEMKNLFGKETIKNAKDNNINNNAKDNNTINKGEKLEISKSYENDSKVKNKYNNYTISNGIRKSLTYRLDDSLNNLINNRKSDSFSERWKSNKFEFCENKINSKIHSSFSQKYFSPMNRSIKLVQRKNALNKVCINNINLKKKKLKIEISQITKYEDSINNKIINENINEQKEKIFNSFKIYNKPEEKNLSFELIGNNDYSNKNYLFNKNERNFVHNINNHMNFKKNKNKTQLEKKPYYKNKNLYLNNIDKENLNYNIYNNINEEGYLIKVKKKNYTNLNYDKTMNKRKPIKVNLNNNNSKNSTNINNEIIDSEIKKKALKDKKEQEQLEDEHLHNLLFKRRESDLLSNIVFMNNDN